jgi:serine/threonine-protein kinase HipA
MAAEPETAWVFARVAGGVHLVGRYQFAATESGRPATEFRYAGTWLRGQAGVSFPLDPVNLPLQHGPFTEPQRSGLFGPLADATPDAWGRRLILAERGGAPMSPVQWLLATGDDRVGCLTFSATPEPPGAERCYVGAASLDSIADAFERLQRGQSADARSAMLYRAGRSLGGARPKTVVEMDQALWIAKFQRHDDEFDQCAAEHAAMRVARDCGIDAAETRIVSVGPRRAVLVRRFDRSGAPGYEPSAHYLSALSLLNLSETSMDGSYSDIAQELLRYAAKPHDDRRELFARMVFNVACGNRDDHLKNHALLCTGKAWSLSPAFDVLPQPGMYPTQAIGIGRSGSYPSRANCISGAGDFGLEPDEAAEIVDGIASVFDDWRDRFRSYGVDAATEEKLASAFTHLV